MTHDRGHDEEAERERLIQWHAEHGVPVAPLGGSTFAVMGPVDEYTGVPLAELPKIEEWQALPAGGYHIRAIWPGDGNEPQDRTARSERLHAALRREGWTIEVREAEWDEDDDGMGVSATLLVDMLPPANEPHRP